MDLDKAKALAENLMEHHLDKTWCFKFNRAVKCFGYCQYSTKTISMSRKLTLVNTKQVFKRVMLHEIAHALTGIGHEHDDLWKKICLEIGGDGKENFSVRDTTLPEPKYTLICPYCGIKSSRARLSKKPLRIACSTCCEKFNNGVFSEKYLFEIIQNY